MPQAANSILTNANLRVLHQLKTLAHYIKNEGYTQSLELLGGNSIGKHYRHIIEFYQCLLGSQGVINYDKRQRSLDLENNVDFALDTINTIIATLEKEPIADDCDYEADFSDDGGENIKVKTSFARELAYNIEHTIHHMAIIQIVVRHYFPHVILEEGFGIAASTLRYQHQISCAQ